MLKIKQLFCHHNYKVEVKRDIYCDDYITNIDIGWLTKIIYTCKKCGKEKIKYVKDKR